jgi:hypothetical protein
VYTCAPMGTVQQMEEGPHRSSKLFEIFNWILCHQFISWVAQILIGEVRLNSNSMQKENGYAPPIMCVLLLVQILLIQMRDVPP